MKDKMMKIFYITLTLLCSQINFAGGRPAQPDPQNPIFQHAPTQAAPVLNQGNAGAPPPGFHPPVGVIQLIQPFQNLTINDDSDSEGDGGNAGTPGVPTFQPPAPQGAAATYPIYYHSDLDDDGGNAGAPGNID